MSIGQKHSTPKKSARILLVDDNAHGLSARKAILEEQGYDVVAKPCPCKALECFGSEPFDMLITDFRMPGMDGRQLIAKVRERIPDLPIVMISGFAEALGLSEATTGADFVIQKSAHEVPVMVRAVDRLLARGKTPRKPVASQSSSRGQRSAAL